MSHSKTTRLIAACFEDKHKIKCYPMTVHSQFDSDSNHHHHPVYRPYNEPMTPVDVNSMNGDLLSLTWLQKGNLIKIPPIDQDDYAPLSMRTINVERKETPLLVEDVKSVNFSNESTISPDQSLATNGSENSNINIIPKVSSPINFIASVNGGNNGALTKPNYSYTHLIFMAIESTPSKCMTVNQIYNWCEANFPFYKHAGAGWKNSLRHNLSINKSFKRLPRDGRLDSAILSGNCVNTAAMGTNNGYLNPKSCNRGKIKTQSRQRHSDTDESVDDYDLEDDDDSEGPGRGAYWAVEPRERPNLIDALKRNPWNITAMAAAAAKINENGTMNFAATLSALGGGRYGLSHSSPGRFLQPSLDDSFSSDKSNNSLSIANSALKLLQNGFSLTSQQMACLINTCYPSLGMNDINFNNIPQQQNIVCNELNDGENPHFNICQAALNSRSSNRSPSPLPFTSEIVGANPAEVCAKKVWEPEEEEKFDCMMKLLQDSNTFNYEQLNNLNISYSSGSSLQRSSRLPNESMLHNDPSKSSNAVEGSTDVSTSKRVASKQKRKSCLKPTIEGNCGECKENKTSNGCEACRNSKLRYYSDFDRLEPQKPALSILDQLDSDQEIGPAGIPALPRAIVPEKTKFQEADNADDVKIEDENDATVTITPAPYIDHEYANCQSHLRGLSETKLVNLYNSRLRWELEFRVNGGTSQLDHSPYDENELGSDDDYKRTFALHGKSKRSRSGRSAAQNIKRPGGSALNKHQLSKRRNMMTSGSNSHGKENTIVSRRSNRVIKAPKRPYDDIEGGYESDFDDEFEFENNYIQISRSKYNFFNDHESSSGPKGKRSCMYTNSASEEEFSGDEIYSESDSSSNNKIVKNKFSKSVSRVTYGVEQSNGEDLSDAEDGYSDLEEQYNMYVDGRKPFQFSKNKISFASKCASDDDADSIEADYLRLAKQRQASGHAVSRQIRSKTDQFKYKSSGGNKTRFAAADLFCTSKAGNRTSVFRRPQWMVNGEVSPTEHYGDSVLNGDGDTLNDSSETLPSHETRDSTEDGKLKDGSDDAAKILYRMKAFESPENHSQSESHNSEDDLAK